jgi:hypothetical protein
MRHVPETKYNFEHYEIGKDLRFYPSRPKGWALFSRSPEGYRVIELLFGNADFHWSGRF